MEIISTTVARRVTLAIIFIAAAVAGVSAQNQRNIRFAAMDGNRDGVITRKEWNGSDRSFQVHDWNRDGILSGEEVRPGAQRPNANDEEFDYSEREYPYADWTARGFSALDHNSDNRITRDEWHFDVEMFRRADRNRDNVLSRAEFLGEDNQDDDRGDRFDYLDANNDGRVSRAEWHGTAERFDGLDDNRDGVLTRAETRGTSDPPPDLFTQRRCESRQPDQPRRMALVARQLRQSRRQPGRHPQPRGIRGFVIDTDTKPGMDAGTRSRPDRGPSGGQGRQAAP